jgi:hypothetical protein
MQQNKATKRFLPDNFTHDVSNQNAFEYLHHLTEHHEGHRWTIYKRYESEKDTDVKIDKEYRSPHTLQNKTATRAPEVQKKFGIHCVALSLANKRRKVNLSKAERSNLRGSDIQFTPSAKLHYLLPSETNTNKLKIVSTPTKVTSKLSID